MKYSYYTILICIIAHIIYAEGISLPDNSIYIGSIENGFFNGKGKLIWKNGSSYIGDFKDGFMHGEGVYKSPIETYTGDFRYGFFNGNGKYAFMNGDLYVGEFKDGIMQGEGFFQFANGNSYLGNFNKGYFDGLGVFTYKNGDVYRGDFEFGSFHGQGSLRIGNKILTGQFLDGEYIGNLNNHEPSSIFFFILPFILSVSIVINIFLYLRLLGKNPSHSE